MTKKLMYLFLIATLISCKNETIKTTDKMETEQEVYEECSCPPIIYLQPLNDYSQIKANQIKNKIQNSHIEIMDGVDIEVLPNKKLSDAVFNQRKTRYRADKILNTYRNNADKHRVIIGLISDDISVPYKGKADWGVLGLSYKRRCVGVVSSYRLKNADRDLWKVVVHEFIHGYFGYGHCPKDSDKCIMQDVKGHAVFFNKHDLCEYCKKQL